MNRNYTTIPIFTIGEIKKMAKKQLRGKWLSLLPIMILFIIVVTVPSLVVQLENYGSRMSDLTAMLDDGLYTDAYSNAAMDFYIQPAFGGAALSVIVTLLSIYSFLTAGVFNTSLCDLSLRILRNEPYSARTIFSGFSQFGKSFLTYLLITIFSFLWMLLFVLPGSIFLGVGIASQSAFLMLLSFTVFFILIIAAVIFLMRYGLAFFIASDDNYTANDTVKRSIQLMRGNISNFFLLQFSFLPWILLLCIPILLTVGAVIIASETASTTGTIIAVILSIIFGIVSLIGNAFLTIYMQTASAVFYSGASGNFRSSVDMHSGDTFNGESSSGFTEYSQNTDSEMAALHDEAESLSSEADDAINPPTPANGSVSLKKEDNRDETISILENDDSLDQLYEDEK